MKIHIDGHDFEAEDMHEGVLIDPVLPEGFDHTPNEERPASHEKFWYQPFIDTSPFHDKGFVFVRCLDGGAWDRSTMLGHFPTIEDAVGAIKQGNFRPRHLLLRLGLPHCEPTTDDCRKASSDRHHGIPGKGLTDSGTDTIDIHISGIGRDRNGNRIGRFVAFRNRTLVGDSGPFRHQLHGGYCEATRNWLASLDIATGKDGGKVYWTGENRRGHVVDVRLAFEEVG